MLLLWIIHVISVLFCYAFRLVCLLMHCGHLLRKGWPLGSRLWCLILTLSLSHWYPGPGVVLDCIDFGFALFLWNRLGSLSQTFYWAQLAENITKYKHPPFFPLLNLLKKVLTLLISFVASSYIFFLKILSCIVLCDVSKALERVWYKAKWHRLLTFRVVK